MANKLVQLKDGADKVFCNFPIVYRQVDLNSINQSCIFTSYDEDSSRPPLNPDTWIMGIQLILPNGYLDYQYGYKVQIAVPIDSRSYSIYIRRCYNSVWEPWKSIRLN